MCRPRRNIVPSELAAALKQQVRGQDHVIDDLTEMISLGFQDPSRKRPVVSVLFVGPRGTGKSSLAKAIAVNLFERESAILTLHCMDFSGGEAASRLLGLPASYRDSTSGGMLTQAMFANPQRAILFDDVDLMHPAARESVLVSLMRDGQLMERHSKKIADFSQAAVILTSNVLHTTPSMWEHMDHLFQEINDPVQLSDAAKVELRNSGEFSSTFVDALDRVCVFQSVLRQVLEEIASIKFRQVVSEYSLQVLHVAPEVIKETARRTNDVREMVCMIERSLGESLMNARARGCKQVRVIAGFDGRPELIEG